MCNGFKLKYQRMFKGRKYTFNQTQGIHLIFFEKFKA